MTNQNETKVLQLIKELLDDPVDFENRGRGNEILGLYYNGILDSIRPLLSHPNASVRGTAMFVAAELGIVSRPLIDAIAPLTDDLDPHIAWDAMDSVLVCATDIFADRFVFVVKQLDNNLAPLRRLAMRLISKASLPQLCGAQSRCAELGNSALVHEQCLQVLIDSECSEISDPEEMLESNTELVRFYGAIVAQRAMAVRPQALEFAAANTNSDVKQFALEAKGMNASPRQ
jgi:hypothetical protein